MSPAAWFFLWVASFLVGVAIVRAWDAFWAWRARVAWDKACQSLTEAAAQILAITSREISRATEEQRKIDGGRS